ncbi:hypothetical protein, conserved [Eimeria brunetti]|uniref:Uncharacterized protein n=1 Tax=Eimeria brunetti TaxID=51314 RepID=U6LQF5_9EIME|nr:hypothetical protein, conserved [Eimeria brunetti]
MTEEPENIKTLEVASASPPFNDVDNAAELNSLASIAPGGGAPKATITPEAQTTGNAGELSLKFGPSENFSKAAFSSCLPGCFTGEHLLSPLSNSSSHRSKSCVPPVEPDSGYSPTAPVANAAYNGPRSDWKYNTVLPATWLASGFRSRFLNNGSVEQNAPSSSSWEVLEEQQQRLESLQQAICYCEEKSSMGRALRSREAAVRARLLSEQLEQQSHVSKARKERNNTLINEAVGFSLRKTVVQNRPAAERLGACLSALHKHMQRSLSSSAFAVASTTPGIGGAQPSLSPYLSQKDHEQLEGKTKAITPLEANLDVPCSVQQKASKGHVASRTDQDSKDSTSVLYEGTADALAARELVQTRATLLLQKQHDNNSSDSLHHLLRLEAEARRQMAFLGAEAHQKKTHSANACGEPVNAVKDCSVSPQIPDETAGPHAHKILPQSAPQRLIADSHLRCTSNSVHMSNGTLQRTAAPVPLNNNTVSEQKATFGEQEWLTLAHQVSVLQEVVLRNQQQHRKPQRKRHSDREHACSKESMQTVGIAGKDGTYSSSGKSGPHDKVARRPSSSPTTAEKCSTSPAEANNDSIPGSSMQIKNGAEAGRRSAAEERFGSHKPRVQQQRERNDSGTYETVRDWVSRAGHNGGMFATSNITPVPDVQHRDCARIANVATSQHHQGDSTRSCGSDAVHKVRSCSGTPLASVTSPSGEDSNNAKARESSTEVRRQLRPDRPSGLAGPLPVSLAAAAVAAYHASSKAVTSDKKSKITGTRRPLTGADSDNTTQGQRSYTNENKTAVCHQLASVGAVPPPEEVANLLLGIK